MLWRDISERVVLTFLETGLSYVTVDMLLAIPAIAPLGEWRLPLVMGLAAVLALLKGTAASRLGNPTSASLVD